MPQLQQFGKTHCPKSNGDVSLFSLQHVWTDARCLNFSEVQKGNTETSSISTWLCICEQIRPRSSWTGNLMHCDLFESALMLTTGLDSVHEGAMRTFESLQWLLLMDPSNKLSESSLLKSLLCLLHRRYPSGWVPVGHLLVSSATEHHCIDSWNAQKEKVPHPPKTTWCNSVNAPRSEKRRISLQLNGLSELSRHQMCS